MHNKEKQSKHKYLYNIQTCSFSIREKLTVILGYLSNVEDKEIIQQNKTVLD